MIEHICFPISFFIGGNDNDTGEDYVFALYNVKMKYELTKN